MSEPTIPALPGYCWPVDWGCAPTEWVAALDPDVKARSEAMAASTLRSLSGYQVGGCPIVVRPCALRCLTGSSYLASPVSGVPGAPPYINGNGQWVNACGCQTGCECAALSEVILPGPVGHIVSVKVDGTEVAPGLYRVDNGNRLVRTDDQLWPACQDMGSAPTGIGSFTVEYLQGVPVDGYGAYAAGLLAYEFAKACGGAACALPKGVTTVVRNGMTIDIEPGSFPSGFTGIFGVDAWLRSVNPYSVVVPAGVYSIDRPPTRQATFGGLV
jgi:hypothetical protein